MRLFLLILLALSGPAAAADTMLVRIGLSRSPASLPALRVMESGALADRARFSVDIWTTPEQLLAMAQNGGHDLFTLPPTMAATLHNKGIPIRMTNVNTWGGIYFATTDPEVRNWNDLAGKTLYLPPRASPPDVLTRYFLRQAGVDADVVRLVNAPVLEIARLLAAGRLEHATLIEPQATIALEGNKAARIVFDFEREWRKFRGGESGLPTLGFGGAVRFIEGNAEFVRDFEEEYEKAVRWLLENPEEAGRLAERHLGLPGHAVAAALPRMGLRYRTAADAAGDLAGLYEVFLEFSPRTIGGAVPDATLYWK